MVNTAQHFAETPSMPRLPPPTLDQHAAEMLVELGFDTDAIAAWRAARTAGQYIGNSHVDEQGAFYAKLHHATIHQAESKQEAAMTNLKDSMLEQLDSVLASYQALSSPQAPNRSESIHTFAYSALAAVERASGEDSSRSDQARKAAKMIATVSTMDPLSIGARTTLFGLVASVRNDVQAGYLQKTQTLVRAELFSNLLDQAEYLLSEGYKDPSAVLCGGVLEAH